MSCNICCENYNKVVRKITRCPYCDYEVCRKCQETFILMSEKLKCMNCDKELSRNFLNEQMQKSFISKKYNKHRGNILFEQEKALMPDTQEDAFKYKKNKEYEQQINDLQEEVDKRSGEIYKANHSLINEKKKLLELLKSNKEIIKDVYKCGNKECDNYICKENPLCNKCNKCTCMNCNKVYKKKHTCKRKEKKYKYVKCCYCDDDLQVHNKNFVYCYSCKLFTDINEYDNPYFYYLIQDETIKNMNFENKILLFKKDELKKILDTIFITMNDRNVVKRNLIYLYEEIMNRIHKRYIIKIDDNYILDNKIENNTQLKYFKNEENQLDELFISISKQLFLSYIDKKINKETFINNFNYFIHYYKKEIFDFCYIDKKNVNHLKQRILYLNVENLHKITKTNKINRLIKIIN